MATSTIYNWDVYCLTTGTYHQVWLPTEPTVCPENNSHTISTNPGPRILSQISTNSVKIIEESEGVTQGNYREKGGKIMIPGGSIGAVTTHTHSWPYYPVTILNGVFNPTADNVGDEINITVSENKVIGGIVSPVSIGDTIITVTEPVISNICKGYLVGLTDGILTDDLGEVIDINAGNNTITTTTPASNIFNPLSPTYVTMTIPLIENIYITAHNIKDGFAKKKIGGKYLSAGETLNIKYTNNSVNAKEFCYSINYIY